MIGREVSTAAHAGKAATAARIYTNESNPRAVIGRYPHRQLDETVVQIVGAFAVLCICAQTAFMYRDSVPIEATQL